MLFMLFMYVPLYVKQMVSVTHGFLSDCEDHSKPSELRGIGDGLIVRVAVISITGVIPAQAVTSIKQSPVLKVTFLLSSNRKFHMNWTFIKRSPGIYLNNNRQKQNQDSSHIYMTCQFPGLVQALGGIQLDAVTQVFFSYPAIDNFIWIEPLLRGQLSYKATLSLSQRWPLNTGLPVYHPEASYNRNFFPHQTEKQDVWGC
jgi:hypothetical protein